MLVRQATVIDGGTIEFQGKRIRLAGIDAPELVSIALTLPELSAPAGRAAAFALADHIGRASVTCNRKQRDRYKRLIAACSVAGADDAS